MVIKPNTIHIPSFRKQIHYNHSHQNEGLWAYTRIYILKLNWFKLKAVYRLNKLHSPQKLKQQQCGNEHKSKSVI